MDSAETRWCHTTNSHSPHTYGPDLRCPGYVQASGAEDLEAVRERLRYTVDRARHRRLGARLDRLLAGQGTAVTVTPPPAATKKQNLWWQSSWTYHLFMACGSLVIQILTHGGFSWWRWLIGWATSEVWAFVLTKALPRLLRSIRKEWFPPLPEPNPTAAPDYSNLPEDQQEWMAYQLAVGAGIEVGVWIPRVDEKVLYWNGAEDGSWGSWRPGRILDLDLSCNPVPLYELTTERAWNGTFRRIDQMKEDE